MRLSEISRESYDGLNQSKAIYISQSKKAYTLHFTAPDSYRETINDDAFFLVGAILAFVLREDYQQSDPVSRKLKEGFETALLKWCDWHKFLHPIQIQAPISDSTATSDAPSDRTTTSFFSGGVDSLFTSSKQGARIGGLISIAHTSPDFEEIHHELNQLKEMTSYADASKREHFLIATNVMTVAPELLDTWSWLTHGTGLAAVAHFLSGEVSSAIISSSDTWETLVPWGSHPEVDELLSSEYLTMEHFGNDYDRAQKTFEIATNPVALEVLSVCHHGRKHGQFSNCSECPKCLRTMITLDLSGVSREEFTTFDWSAYDPKHIENFKLASEDEIVFLSEIVELCEAQGKTDLARSIKLMIERSRHQMFLKGVEKYLRRRIPLLSRFRRTLISLRKITLSAIGLSPKTSQ